MAARPFLLLLGSAVHLSHGTPPLTARRPHNSSVPPQLNASAFAQCLSSQDGTGVLPDLRLMRSAHALTIDDGLLVYTALSLPRGLGVPAQLEL